MNIIKRIQAPTPDKYKKWAKLFRDISLSLGAGIAACAAFGLHSTIIMVVGIVTFVTTSISTFLFAQVEPPVVDKVIVVEPKGEVTESPVAEQAIVVEVKTEELKK